MYVSLVVIIISYTDDNIMGAILSSHSYRTTALRKYMSYDWIIYERRKNVAILGNMHILCSCASYDYLTHGIVV